MKNFKFILYILISLLWGCKSEEIELTNLEENKPVSETSVEKKSHVIKGLIRVKLKPETGDSFSATRSTSGELRSDNNEIDAFLHQIGAETMQRVFPYAGKYEERTRREGLHLWYDIVFDKSKPVTRAASDARNIPGVDIVEEVYNPVIPPYTITSITPSQTRSTAIPVNDPLLKWQWHYNNTGALGDDFVPGADINLFRAWEKETGKPDVVVAIVDGGIETTHEDLAESLYVNVAELNGTPGVDDDNNGFVDDIYGYNFVSKTGKIVPHDHGTHVAGTVAARNNNGVGVCGVAGGNGSADSGVRLLSCQIFENDKGGNPSAAIKYAADNGAVIAQNSWGYPFGTGIRVLPESDKAAIDYFIKYAGCDNDGKQLPDSPMRGGVLIFAAGNDGTDFTAQPASYEPIVSVSAMASDFKKAYYTTMGDWVDVMAPGGDENYGWEGLVASTYLYNGYASMQGTSMACPHVSGIAALVVSKFGGPGFENEELKKRITSAFRPYDINEYNPKYKGRLGGGYIDADKALSTNENKVPGKVGSVSVEEDFTSLKLEWKAVSDEDDGTANMYKLYYSDKEKLTENNYKNAHLVNVRGASYKPGDNIVYTLENLSLHTRFYFAMLAEDRWGLQSAPIFFEAETKENHPPVLERVGPEKIYLTGDEAAEVTILVQEPDKQVWTYTIDGEVKGVTISKKEDGLTLKFRAVAPAGKYNISVRVADIFDAAATIDIPFEVYENHPPKQIKDFQKLFIPINKSDYEINLSEYFSDEDGHAITYSARSNDPSVVGIRLTGEKLNFSPVKTGPASIKPKP